jgi:hypothetical protein
LCHQIEKSGWDSFKQAIGDVAQLVEQRTENPCVGGSIPSITTNFFGFRIIFD